MNYIVDLVEKTKSELDLFADITPMRLPESDNGIAVKPAPSQNNVWRFDGNHEYGFSVQLLVRSRNWYDAWMEINKIHNLWNGAGRDLIPYMTFMQSTTGPNHIDVNEQGQHEFTAIYTATIERG